VKYGKFRKGDKFLPILFDTTACSLFLWETYVIFGEVRVDDEKKA